MVSTTTRQLKAASVTQLKNAVDLAIKDAVAKVPTLSCNPRPLWGDIEEVVLFTLSIGKSSAVRRDNQRIAVLQFRGRMSIISAVQGVVACERAEGDFHGAGGLTRLHNAIDGAVLDILDSVQEKWASAPTTTTTPPRAKVETLRRVDVETLPREIVANILSRLDVGDLRRAASICDLWMDVAEDPIHRALWAEVQCFWTRDGCRVIHAIDVDSDRRKPTPTTLPGWLVPEFALYAPHIQLVRPTKGIFQRAVAALPPGEPLFLRVYDTTPGRMHFAFGSPSGDFRECVHVEWDFWTYVQQCGAARELLRYRVRDADVPDGDASSFHKIIKCCFPRAQRREGRVKKRRGILDHPDTSTGAHTAAPPSPLPDLHRLLWPQNDAGSGSEQYASGVSEGDVFGEY